ncbi:uncharacterized protein Dwil_GK16822 [Drosophila willistoni]|uniref:Uncharacterized protein n=1 Tax=Drosophila willistoni TaxID=7260 RepID=B4ML42_DROWI|nr:uncharacterized protein LOC6638886 [Drosophila willistoni]EDW73100.1 uncharacterized protein Dwil_GK16822 [Drosophila willistoni]
MAPKNSAKSCGFVETEEGENGKCSFILTLDSDGHMEISPHNVKEEPQQQKPQSESQPERICSGVCSKEIKPEPSTSNKRRISIAILKHDPAEEGAVAEGVGKGVGVETHDIVSIGGGIQGAGAALPRFVKIYNKDLGSKPSFVVLEDAVVRKRIEENLQPATCHCNAQQQTSPCDIGAHTSSQTDEYLLEYAVRPQLVKRAATSQRVQQRQRSGAGIVESTGSPHVTISFLPQIAAGNNNNNNSSNNMVYPSSSHTSCSTCSSCSCACSNHCCFLQPSGVLPTPEPQVMGYYPHPLPLIGSHCSHMTLPTAAAAPATLTQQQYPFNNWYPSHSHQCLYYHPPSTMNMTSGCPSPHCGATCCMHGHGHHSHGHCGKCFNQQQQQQQQQPNYPPTCGRSKRAKHNSCGESTERSEKFKEPPQENVVPLPTSFSDSSTMNPSETLQISDTGRSIAGAADICSGEKCSAATTSLCMARFGRTCLILRPTTPTAIPRLLTKRISRYTSMMAWPSGNKMIHQKPAKIDSKEVTQIN